MASRNLGLLVLVLVITLGAPAAFAQDRLGGIFANGLAYMIGPHAGSGASAPAIANDDPAIALQRLPDGAPDLAAALSTNPMTSATAR